MTGVEAGVALTDVWDALDPARRLAMIEVVEAEAAAVRREAAEYRGRHRQTWPLTPSEAAEYATERAAATRRLLDLQRAVTGRPARRSSA